MTGLRIICYYFSQTFQVRSITTSSTSSKLIMKILLSLAFLFRICFVQAQHINFEQTVHFIQQKVTCCSVPFAASTKRKVDFIDIEKNGDITISYSDNKLKQTFNLFDLYKEEEGATGIDTIMGGKFIQFYVNPEKIRMIRFATTADARDVYIALLRLLSLCKRESKMFSDLNFAQTLELINIRLVKWAEKSNIVTVIAEQNGNVVISNKHVQSFLFNLFDLSHKEYNNNDDAGIETINCDTNAHAPLAWINFNKARGNVAFIRLDCHTPKEELEIIRYAFLHLRSLCTKDDVFNKPPSGAIYFVSRNAVLKTENEMLVTSIRSIDKKDEGDTTLSVSSNAEGWLDKDSLPIGRWNFYAKNKLGKEYLFKSGTYHLTKAEMFKVINIDSSDLARNYRLSFYTLQKDHVKTIPFIKSGEWNYYHPDGKLWKKVSYQNENIPIHTEITETSVNGSGAEASTALIIILKDKLDEWIDFEVSEYDEQGNLFKRLQYYHGDLYKKILYDKYGSVIKTETAKQHEKNVLPNNY